MAKRRTYKRSKDGKFARTNAAASAQKAASQPSTARTRKASNKQMISPGFTLRPGLSAKGAALARERENAAALRELRKEARRARRG